MRALRRASMVAGITLMSTAGLATQAHASANSGWVYTSNSSGAVYFDADLNGYPGYEKITVCDNKTDGRGVQALVQGYDGGGNVAVQLYDPSNDGDCTYTIGNFFLEETAVDITVYNYWGFNKEDYGYGSGVA
ncbi:hypothetical protein OK074_7016 [Actinobacteria bacterium OK074]|nr:hypothetical protein OK074_7016 [Actinobacteria bacterium OK074]